MTGAYDMVKIQAEVKQQEDTRIGWCNGTVPWIHAVGRWDHRISRVCTYLTYPVMLTAAAHTLDCTTL
jgi:hypothetical protein